MEEGRKKLAVVHAKPESDEGTATVSAVLQSSEQFDGSTSISSNSASTGTIHTVSHDYENFGLTRTAAISQRQQIMAAGDQLSSASRQRRLALISQRERHAARVSMSAEDKTQALQSMLRIQDDDRRVNHVGKIDGQFATLADPGVVQSLIDGSKNI